MLVSTKISAMAMISGDQSTAENGGMFDLSTYIQPYQGQTKLLRLLYISEREPVLKPIIQSLVLQELQSGLNTDLYKKLCENSFLPSSSAASAETVEWMRTAEGIVASKLDILTAELHAAKASMIKENFRVACNGLGQLFYQKGHLDEALKYYMRAQEGCTLPKHFHEMALNVATISIDLNMFANASIYCGNAPSADGALEVQSKIAAIQGLVSLNAGVFKSAAISFLSVKAEYGSNLSSIISKEDIAVYAVVCSLVTFDRAELKRHFFDNRSFTNDFLSAVPAARELIINFYEGNYVVFTKVLKDLRRRMDLDLHLTRHVPMILEAISEKVHIQYFMPYAVVDIHRMAVGLDQDELELEKALVKLISDQKLSARIDSASRTMYRYSADARGTMVKNALELSRVHVNEVKRNILRLSVLKHNFYVSEPDVLQQHAVDGDNCSVGELFYGSGGGAGMGGGGGWGMEGGASTARSKRKGGAASAHEGVVRTSRVVARAASAGTAARAAVGGAGASSTLQSGSLHEMDAACLSDKEDDDDDEIYNSNANAGEMELDTHQR